MTSKLNGVRRTLFPSDTDDIASAKSTNSINSKFSAIRWINPNVIIFIISATILTIYDGFELVRSSLIYLSSCVRNTNVMMFEWPEHISYYDFAQMLIISSMITIFAMAITYYDSDVPGVNPPTPFSPRKANRMQYAVHKQKSHKLSYLTAIASGLVTFTLLFISKANV